MRLNATGLDVGLLRYWQGHQQAILSSQGQLASGLRIMGAAQDAAGLSIATKLGAQIRGHHAANRSMQDGLSMLRLADSGMNDVMTNLQAMRDLTVRAANGTLTAADRNAIKAELDALSAGIDQIVTGTHFNTMRILGGAAETSALSPSTLVGRTPISLFSAGPATTATMLGGGVSLNLSQATLATRATMDSGAIALDLSGATAATYASLMSGAIARNLGNIAGPTIASLLGGSVSLNTSNAVLESTAYMDSAAITLNTSNATPAIAATMLTGPVSLNPAASIPATAATLTSNRVQISQDGNPASLKGDNISLTGNSTDFGSIVINGVTTALGVYNGSDKDAAAQWVADKINADPNSKVIASVGTNDKRIELISKATGANSFVQIGAGTSTQTGFNPGEQKFGTGSTVTDFGSVTINGVAVSLGTISNANLSSQTAAQFIAQKINASSLSGTLTASVGGTFSDQLVLTTNGTGAGATLSIDSSTSNSNADNGDDGINGFVAGITAAGTNGVTSQTDLGSVTINGVTTSFGTLANPGLTSTAAAQHMVDQINQNAASTVTASLAGTNNDQILLTAKTAGTAGNFTISSTTNESNANATDNGSNGFTGGAIATGTDADAGDTDFGSISINGTTVNLGLFDNNGKTGQDAVQWILGKINATGGVPVTASAIAGDKIRLTSTTTGAAGSFSITSSTNNSNGLGGDDGSNGFTAGMTATGQDADAGDTDFGAITIGGTTVNLGLFDNNGKTAQDAAQWIVDQINAAGGVPVTASRSGDQIQLTSDTAGSAGSFTVTTTSDSNGNGTDNGTLGIASGTAANGLDADLGDTDFGSVTVNGTTVNLGLFDNNSGDDAAATQWIVDKINAAGATATASRSGNQITLTATTAGAAGSVTINSATNNSNGLGGDDGSNGFTGGATATGTNANAGSTDFGSVTINGTTVNLGLFDNNGKTAQDAAQWIVSQINGTGGVPVTASAIAGNQIRLTSTVMGAGGSFDIDASTSASNGFTAGATATGTDADAGDTDFGSVTINGTTVNLGLFDNNGKTAQDAAQWIVNQINGTGGVPVTASLSGSQIRLTSDTPGAAGSFTVAVNNDSNGSGADTGIHGLTAGTASGTDATSGLTDFGQITINGTTIALGVLDSNTYTDATAASHLANLITAANAGVTATVQGGRLVLTSVDPEAELVITGVTADSNGNASDDASVGFLAGDSDSPGSSSDDSGSRTLSQGIIIQLGADAGQVIELKTPLDAYADTLGVQAASMDISSQAAAAATLQRIDAAMERAGTIRASLGANMNRVEHSLAVSMVAGENLTAAESRIMGVDIAQSLLSMTRSQIASQAAQTMLKHMHFGRDQVLRLLA
jgi:flagellin